MPKVRRQNSRRISRRPGHKKRHHRAPVRKPKIARAYQERAETILISEGTNDTAPAPLCDVFHTPTPAGIDKNAVIVPEKSFFEQTSYNNTVSTLDQSLKVVGRSTFTRYLNLRAEVDMTACVGLSDNDTRIRVLMGYLPILMPQNATNGNSYQKFVEDQFNAYYDEEKLFGGLGQKNVFRIFSDKTHSITPKMAQFETNSATGPQYLRRNVQISGSFPMTKGKKYYKPSDVASGNIGNLVIDSESGRRINIPFLAVMNVDGLGNPAQGTSPKVSYRWAHYFNDS
jgi:hypothetical protein